MLCRASLISAFLPLLGACAGSMPKEAPTNGVAANQASPGTSGQERRDVASTESGSDPKAAEINDPWEGFNRPMHRFNSYADKFLIRPLAVAYDWVTPTAVQAGVSRFLGNLGEPRTAANQLLQGRPLGAAESLSRFVVNTTVGIGGVFDPAKSIGLPAHKEDLGQTLAVWGWTDSRYLVLPLFGPRTVRDTVSIFGDSKASPTSYVDNGAITNAITVLKLADARTRAMPMDKVRESMPDDYVFVRDRWVTRRNADIKE